jgi:hypothetical protein
MLWGNRPECEADGRGRLWVVKGLVLLAFIAAACALAWTAARRALGIESTGRNFLRVITVVGLGLLALWVYTTHR